MAEQPLKPPLKKPPGYRDPTEAGRPATRPQPLRKPVLPASFQPRKRRRSWCRLCCCFFVVFLSILAVAVTIAAGIFYLWFDPKLPVFHLQSLRIPRFNVTARSDGTYLDAAAVARVEAKNPNSKLTVYYGSGRAEFAVGGDTELGSDDVAEFSQGNGSATSLKVETAVKGMLVEDGVGKRLRNGFRRKELVVNIRVLTRVGYIVQGVRVGAVAVRVVCGGVSLKRLGSGDMPKCTIEFLNKWIKIH